MQTTRKEGGFDRLPNQPRKELRFSDFAKNENLGIGLPVLVIIKDTDRLARSQRLLQTHTQRRGFHGRAHARDFLTGFSYLTQLTSTLDTPDKSQWYQELPEPRNISFAGNDIMVTAADKVHIFNTETKKETVIDNPYFGSLHTAIPNGDRTKFIVSSTGFDSILEFDRTTRKETWRWTAWDHGYNKAANGSLVTENPQEAELLREAGNDVILVDDSIKRAGFGIPTAYRTTHVNEAIYDYDENKILATLYHKGTVVRIDRQTGDSEVLMEGLSHPHAIQKDAGGYIVTDTSHGTWYQLDKDFRVQTKVDFRDFPGKPEEMKDIEWVQYVAPIGKGVYVAADANRQAAWVFDTEKQEYNHIVTNPEWSVQAILPMNPTYRNVLPLWQNDRRTTE